MTSFFLFPLFNLFLGIGILISSPLLLETVLPRILFYNYLIHLTGHNVEGRQMIEHTKKLVEDKFTVLGGYEHNAEVNSLCFLLNPFQPWPFDNII